MSLNFVHLHNHSEYSLLDGACRIKDLVSRARELGMPAIAITDHGVLYGVIDFYREALQQGIKPIIGCEVYVAPRSYLDKERGLDDKPHHLVLLCKDNLGYHNLIEIVSHAFLDGFYYKPRVDRDILRRYNKGLIALSACVAGEIPRLILDGKFDQALQTALLYRDIFGSENFYLELQDHGMKEEKAVIKGLCDISDKTGIPLVATNDIHYIHKKDAAAHDVLLCIQTGSVVNEQQRMRFPGSEFYMKSAAEMQELFKKRPDAIENSLQIAQQCEVSFKFGEFYLPYFNIPNGYTPESYFEKMVREAFARKYTDPAPDAIKRLEHEIKVISQMGFAGYFLIVQDLVNWAKDNGVPVGPGRGSAAGSLVSYVLGITTIDPLKYDLLFERFLNPERVSMPDIDIDFCFEKRDKVIEYIVEQYGADHVAQIITFGTMAARAAIRDVGRALDIPYGEVDRLAKMVPAELGVTIDRSLEIAPELSSTYQSDTSARKIIDMARAIEGMPRHASIHAAGVVIGKDTLTSILPLQKTPEGHVITQFTKETVEDIGLLKMDILGLRTLTVISRALQIIEKTQNKRINLDGLPLDDKKVYDLVSSGDTIGVFQVESAGLRRILTEMKPERFEDLIAVIALYRPGPLGSGMVEDFINRKHGLQKIEYIHPLLENILKETYGVILYQEQVMRVASDLAGFTMGEADVLRRAMGKKKPEELAAQRDKFVAGAARCNNIDKKIAIRLFDIMESFAGYGFNKSHSAAYALITYQTAYLKAYYPVEYMCAFLTSVIGNQDRIVFYLKECRNMGIEILPPDINESYENFTVAGAGIRFGLGAIKNVGINAVKSVVEIRNEGRFTSLFNFCMRVDLGIINKRALENLILAGCFDSLEITRKQAMNIMDECVEMALQVKQYQYDQQISLFGDAVSMIEEPIPRINGEFSSKDLLNREKEVLGFYVSANPLDEYRELIPLLNTYQLGELNNSLGNIYVRIAGIIINLTRKVSRRGDKYARFFLEDLSNRMEVMVFPSAYRRNSQIIQPEQVVVIEGFLDTRDEQLKISLQKVQPIPAHIKELNIRIEENNNTSAKKDTMISLLKNFPGDQEVILHLPGGRVLVLNDGFNVTPNMELKKKLSDIFGQENIWFA